jgi:CelD/BcsL family acetyltransferase involved in cellulose biosynthesis
VQISVIRPDELGAAEIAAWRCLQARSESLSNPFLSPDFTIAIGRVRPQARVAVLADGPKIVGFFPFERRSLGLGVAIGAGLSDCQGVIHAPGAEWQPRMLLRACGLSAWEFDHLVAGQGPFERYRMALEPSPIIDLTRGFDAYYQALKASAPRFCNDAKRKTRKLQRLAGDVRLVVDSRGTGALHTLMAWKSDQYRRTGRMDRFSRPWIVELLETLLDTRNDHFRGLLSVLYAGDAPVAAHFGVQAGDVLADWFPAYDTAVGRCSPGLILTLRMAEAVAAEGVHRIDMGKGFKRYKEVFKSHDIFVAEGIVTRRSPLAAANYVRSTLPAWTTRQIRRHEPLYNAADALLRRYGVMHHALRPVAAAAGRSASPAAAKPDPAEEARSAMSPVP